jgi:hypothetical protein
MRRHIAAATAAAVLLTPGCAAGGTAEAPTGAELEGTWVQNGAGFEKGVPVTWNDQKVVIEKADGQGFTGYKEYTREGEPPQREIINGVVGTDGRILITDEDGLFDGRLSDGKITGQYAETGDDAGAINVELVRAG